jgi:hypothetical protein
LPDDNGVTRWNPLCFAIMQKNTTLALTLIEEGADLESQMVMQTNDFVSEMTALYFAI